MEQAATCVGDRLLIRLLFFRMNRHRTWQIVKECAQKAGLPLLVNPETGRMHGLSPHRLWLSRKMILLTASGCCRSSLVMSVSAQPCATARSLAKN